MARQHLYTRLARRGWPVVYSTGPQSLWERHSEKWRRGGLLPTFDRVEAGDGAVVMVDRPGKGLPLRNHEGAWNFLATGRHARPLLKGAADRTRRRPVNLWHTRFWPYPRLLDASSRVFPLHEHWAAKPQH